MSDVSKALKSILDANSGVTAIVGTKIYPMRPQQTDSAPYVVWYVLNTTPFGTKKNHNNNGNSPVDRFDVQVNCVGSTYTSATNLASAVRTALDRYADTTFSGVSINGIDFQGERDEFDDEMNLFVKQLEYSIRRKN